MRFDLTDLQLFLHVAESGSLTAGAARSHLALASASARVRGMEDALGIALLTRGRRGVAPTPAGQALLHHARLVLRQIDKMHGELGEYAQGLKGRVRLLCNTVALSEFVPQALDAFLRRHPNVNVDLEERLSHDIVNALAEGSAEIGIVAQSTHLASLADLAGLETLPFRLDRLVAIGALSGPGAFAALPVPDRHGAVAFGALCDADFIGLAGDSALQRYLAQHAARAGRILKVRVRLPGFDAICRMVESGVGISVVPEAAALRCGATMAIRALPLSDPWAVRQLTLCARRFSDLPAYTRQLVEELKA